MKSSLKKIYDQSFDQIKIYSYENKKLLDMSRKVIKTEFLSKNYDLFLKNNLKFALFKNIDSTNIPLKNTIKIICSIKD